MRDRFSKERGFALLVMGVTLVLVVFMVALAVDAAFLYLVRARLSASCDAAALAAARSVNVGMTLAAQEASAKARANAFFSANYPAGTLNTKNLVVNIVVAESGLRTRTVTVAASVQAPTYFLRMAKYSNVNVAATGTASRRDVNMIIVLDRSGSMQNSGSCEPMKSAARSFVSNFAEGRDRLALITFSSGMFVGYAPSKNFKSTNPTLDSVISTITCTGGTSSAMAISEAYNQLVTINEPGALNMILFFTDGVPTALTAYWPVKKLSDTRYGDGSSSYSNAASTYTYPKSTCYDAAGRANTSSSWAPQDRLGVMATIGSADAATGASYGVYARYTTGVNAADVSINGATSGNESRQGCNFGSGTTNLTRVRRDIAYIPTQDAYGNATGCCYDNAITTFPNGHSYQGKFRPDKPINIGAAARNATDNAATRIRSDSNLTPTFYVIGLGDPGGADPPDEVLLAKIANDPVSPSYTRTQPTGLYVFAPDNTQLNQAFARIASEILRLSN
ncbi:MAG: VWA domain-containing protein [Acidobacteria bacterium]|nr:VWA domain-containing protein [Acidobacteriota bacterium]